MAKNNTERFSNRVADYVKYRPGYPEEIISYLQQLVGDKGYEPMINALQELFNKYQENGLIRINYTTNVYAGEFK